MGWKLHKILDDTTSIECAFEDLPDRIKKRMKEIVKKDLEELLL